MCLYFWGSHGMKMTYHMSSFVVYCIAEPLSCEVTGGYELPMPCLGLYCWGARQQHDKELVHIDFNWCSQWIAEPLLFEVVIATYGLVPLGK